MTLLFFAMDPFAPPDPECVVDTASGLTLRQYSELQRQCETYKRFRTDFATCSNAVCGGTPSLCCNVRGVFLERVGCFCRGVHGKPYLETIQSYDPLGPPRVHNPGALPRFEGIWDSVPRLCVRGDLLCKRFDIFVLTEVHWDGLWHRHWPNDESRKWVQTCFFNRIGPEEDELQEMLRLFPNLRLWEVCGSDYFW